MANPAKACECLSIFFMGIILTPFKTTVTQKSIVTIVQTEKTTATAATDSGLFSAAGYISKGISGSQGPSTNNMKSGQNERDMCFFWE
jgi:hypothetical protein